MILYFAGGAHEKLLHGGDILESFWYRKDAERAMTHASRFFLDSGAFTAFTKGAVIDIENYTRFIEANRERITVASSLDAIGDAEGSYRNLKRAEELGAKVIPVFHCREDFDWLRRYLDEGYEYIALGGMVPEVKAWIAKWLEQVWGLLVDDEGRARVKVHGFGMTILDFMEKYPWHSVDSTSWTYGGRFGAMLVLWPTGRNSWVYTGDQHTSRKQWREAHLEVMSKPVRDYVLEWAYKVSGLTYEKLRADTSAISQHNIKAFQHWATTRPTDVRYLPHEGLFDA
jgi:hypothetical protein